MGSVEEMDEMEARRQERRASVAAQNRRNANMKVVKPAFLILGHPHCEFTFEACIGFAAKGQQYFFQEVELAEAHKLLAPPHNTPQLLYAGVPSSSGADLAFGLETGCGNILRLLDELFPADRPAQFQLFPEAYPLAEQLHDDVSNSFSCYTCYWFLLDEDGFWRSYGPDCKERLPFGLQWDFVAEWLVSDEKNQNRERVHLILAERYSVDSCDNASIQAAFDLELQYFEGLLEDKKWIGGTPKPSAADIALYAMLVKLCSGVLDGTLPPCHPDCINEYPRLQEWLHTCKEQFPIYTTSLTWAVEDRAAIQSTSDSDRLVWGEGAGCLWQTVPIVKMLLEGDTNT